MIDQTTLSLFNEFPREVSLQRYPVVKNLKEFDEYILINNGNGQGCFTSVHRYKDLVLDKIIYDLDLGNALETHKNLNKQWINHSITPIPTISGKKGYHNYIKFKKKTFKSQFEMKEAILKASYGLLEMAGYVKNIPQCVDTTVFDVRQILRIPNTKRPPKNVRFCTYLPPDFYRLSKKEIEYFSYKTNAFEYDTSRTLLSFDEFNDIELEKFGVQPLENIPENDSYSSFDEGKMSSSIDMYNALLHLVRPCIVDHMTRWNPRHVVRISASCDLLQYFEIDFVAKIFEKMNWYDWKGIDWNIRKLKEFRGWRPYTKKSLITKGVCHQGCDHSGFDY